MGNRAAGNLWPYMEHGEPGKANVLIGGATSAPCSTAVGAFHAHFERACQEKSIKLFILLPHSSKLNGSVERAQRTHAEEFYELYDGDLELAPLNKALGEWSGSTTTSAPTRFWTLGRQRSILPSAIQTWPPKANCLICSGSGRVQLLAIAWNDWYTNLTHNVGLG